MSNIEEARRRKREIDGTRLTEGRLRKLFEKAFGKHASYGFPYGDGGVLIENGSGASTLCEVVGGCRDGNTVAHLIAEVLNHAQEVATTKETLLSVYFRLSAAAGILESDKYIFNVGVCPDQFQKDALLAGRDAALLHIREAKDSIPFGSTAFMMVAGHLHKAIDLLLSYQHFRNNHPLMDRRRLEALAEVNAARSIFSVVMDHDLQKKAA